MHAAQAPRVTGGLLGQQRRQPLALTGLCIAVDCGLIQAQVLGDGRRRPAVVEHQ